MTTDDQDGNERRKSRRDTDKPTRDTRGRWRQGYCPNPNGRPKKKAKMLPDQADIRIFGNTMVDIVANGQRETMDRRTAPNNKMFESAMKGKQRRVSYKRTWESTIGMSPWGCSGACIIRPPLPRRLCWIR